VLLLVARQVRGAWPNYGALPLAASGATGVTQPVLAGLDPDIHTPKRLVVMALFTGRPTPARSRSASPAVAAAP